MQSIINIIKVTQITWTPSYQRKSENNIHRLKDQTRSPSLFAKIENGRTLFHLGGEFLGTLNHTKLPLSTCAMFTYFPEDLFKDKSAHLDRWRLVKRAFFENCTESHAVLQSERIANDVQQTSKNRSLWQIRNNFMMTKLPKEELQFP